MRKLTAPQYVIDEVFQECIGNIRDDDLKDRMSSISITIVSAAEEYRVAALGRSLHEIQTHEDVGGVVTKKEMNWVYRTQMAKIGRPGRHVYDSIKLSPKNGTCPLCGHGQVSTLDHHLPQSYYPAFVVTPINLVPACSDCNKIKLNDVPQSPGGQTLHPYFDDVEADRWLYADVLEVAPAAFRYFVNPPAGWDQVMKDRVDYHFTAFRLGKLFSSQAASLSGDIRDRLERLHVDGGMAEVRDYLEEEAVSRERVHLNSWQTAAYHAMAGSDWFCDGGFRIPG